MVSVAGNMQEQLAAHKTAKRNKENLRTVDVLAVGTKYDRNRLFIATYYCVTIMCNYYYTL